MILAALFSPEAPRMLIDDAKESAVHARSDHAVFPFADMIAFGDNCGAAGILRLCGTGVAVADAMPEAQDNALTAAKTAALPDAISPFSTSDFPSLLKNSAGIARIFP